MIKQIKSILIKYPPFYKVLRYLYNLFKSILGFVFSFIVRFFDLLIPKSKNIWIFPVHFYIHSFSDNCRAVYEVVKEDSRIKKVILTRDKTIDEFNHDKMTLILPMRSPRGIWMLLRAKVVFVQHSFILDFGPLNYAGWLAFNLKLRRLVNLWHGIIIKRVGVYTRVNNWGKGTDRSPLEIRIIKTRKKEQKHYIIPTSSFSNRMAIMEAFYPVKPKNVVVTGYPRNDFLLRHENQLPSYCLDQLSYIDDKIGERKLIVYAPTYRELRRGGGNYDFSVEEIAKLRTLLLKHNAVLGLRLHYHNRSVSFEKLIDDELFFDLDQKYLPDMEMIIRKAHIIISDYSALVVDSIYIRKPVICFAYDFDDYNTRGNGFVYPLSLINPFSICRTFNDLETNISNILNNNWALNRDKLDQIWNLFFEYDDSMNSQRLVKHLIN